MSPSTATPEPTTLAAWKTAAIHTIQLETRTWVRLRFPNLGELVANEALPETLLGVAMLQVFTGDAAGSLADEMLRLDGDELAEKQGRLRELNDQLGQLERHLVAHALVEPKVTADQLAAPDFPQEDLQLLGDLVMRRRRTDARGVHLGVVPLETFRVVREAHGCLELEQRGEACPGCQELERRLSTDRPGSL